jgi:hypothetical protein
MYGTSSIIVSFAFTTNFLSSWPRIRIGSPKMNPKGSGDKINADPCRSGAATLVCSSLLVLRRKKSWVPLREALGAVWVMADLLPRSNQPADGQIETVVLPRSGEPIDEQIETYRTVGTRSCFHGARNQLMDK